MALANTAGCARSPSTGSKDTPAKAWRSLPARTSALTPCPRAANWLAKLAPINPDAPVRKQFIRCRNGSTQNTLTPSSKQNLAKKRNRHQSGLVNNSSLLRYAEENQSSTQKADTPGT